MLLYLLILMPLAFTFYCFLKKDKQIFIPALTGFMSAVLFCALKAFFTFTHRVVPYSFWENFLFYFVKEIMPLIVIYALYFLLSKDTIEYKTKIFFSLICAFEIVFLPYTAISNAETRVYSGFDLFILPSLILSLIVELNLNVNYLYNAISQKKVPRIILNVLLILVYIFLFCVISTFYTLGYPIWLVLLVSGLYIFAPILYYSYMLFIKKN
ncbi:MAG: hypothetical protein K5866_04440 [Treponema sp.]|nr:hypothetical protein [Treponema sp.]